MKKKMLGFLLAVCIAMALVPMAAFAEGQRQNLNHNGRTSFCNSQKLWTMANMTIKQMRLYRLTRIWI